MSSLFRDLDWGNWTYGLLYGSIGGGANSVYAAFGALVVDPKDFAFGSAKSFKLMGWVFAFSALMSAFFYLKQKPLPDKMTSKEQTSLVATDAKGSTITMEKTVTVEKPVEKS